MEIGVAFSLISGIIGVLAFVATGAAYAGFRSKVKDLFVDVGNAWAMTYSILRDLQSEKYVSPGRIETARVAIEEVWTEACELAPFVREIFSRFPKTE